MLHSPIHRAQLTPSQRLEAIARQARRERFEQSARTIAGVQEVNELPLDKTEPPAAEDWVDRQKKIHTPPRKELWFSIVEEIHTDEPRRPRIEEIQAAVAKHYGVTRSDLLSARRTQIVVRPRQVGYFLSKMLTLNSLPQIGRRFGDRDHTSILSGIKKITRLMASDEELAQDVHALAASLGGSIA